MSGTIKDRNPAEQQVNTMKKKWISSDLEPFTTDPSTHIGPSIYSSFSMGYYSTITGVPADGYDMVVGAFVLDYVLYHWS